MLIVLLTPAVANAGYASNVGPYYFGCRNTIQMSTLTTTTVVTVTTNCNANRYIQTELTLSIDGRIQPTYSRNCGVGVTKCVLSHTYSNPGGTQKFYGVGSAQIDFNFSPTGGVGVTLYG